MTLNPVVNFEKILIPLKDRTSALLRIFTDFPKHLMLSQMFCSAPVCLSALTCPEISKRALGYGSFLIGLGTLELSDLHHQYCPRLAPDP